MKENTLHYIHVALFALWIMLLLPWLPFAPASAMAFDPGPSFGAYLFVICVWTYPITVLFAWIFRDKSPVIPFLPFLNIALPFLADLVWKSN